jgi:hypothetical protein
MSTPEPLQLQAYPERLYSPLARLIAAGLQAVEVAEDCHTPEDLPRAGKAFIHYATVLAHTHPEVQQQAMDSRDERGNPPPTLVDAFNAYQAAAQRACGSNFDLSA